MAGGLKLEVAFGIKLLVPSTDHVALKQRVTSHRNDLFKTGSTVLLINLSRETFDSVYS